jgi:hypothetical protein
MMVLEALETHFRQEYREWDLLRWDGVLEGNGHKQHAGVLVGAPGRQPNYVVPLPASWAELHSQVTGNFRSNMRKQREIFESAPSMRGRLAMQAYETVAASRRVTTRLRYHRNANRQA